MPAYADDAYQLITYLPVDLSSFPWARPNDSLMLKFCLEAVVPHGIPAGCNSFQANGMPVGSKDCHCHEPAYEQGP